VTRFSNRHMQRCKVARRRDGDNEGGCDTECKGRLTLSMATHPGSRPARGPIIVLLLDSKLM
jgi:hypothetical protein